MPRKKKPPVTNKIEGFYNNIGERVNIDTCSYVKIKLLGNHARIKNAYMLISKSDLQLCLNYKWYLSKDGYPATYGTVDNTERYGVGWKIYRMLEPVIPKGMVVDHINRDRLDNRRENLRICTIAENGYNKTKVNSEKSGSTYKGVKKTKNGWTASVTKDGKKHEMKNLNSEKEAAFMYDIMAEELFGHFAAKNNPYDE
jgi:hypothetical protein